MPIGNGGIIGPANVPTITTASGVWSLREQQQAQGRGAWPLALLPDPYFEYTTLLLPGSGTNGAQNNTFLDGSTNNFTITRNGNTTQGTFSPFSQTGWGNYFDGSGDYLSVANSTFLQLSNADWTIECWVYVTSTTGNQRIISQSDSNYEFAFYMASGSLTAYSFQSAGTQNFAISMGTLVANQWYHIAATRSGSTIRAFVNGIQTGSATFSGTIDTRTGGWKIGSSYTGTENFSGYISNARIVKGTAVYTANFTPPTSPLTAISGTSLLTCQSNRFIDNSTNNFTITVNGNTSVVAFSPFNPTASWSAATYGGSGYFDGSGDYLSVPDNAALRFGTGDFCFETWVYLTALPASFGDLICKGTNNAGTFEISVISTGKLGFYTTVSVFQSVAALTVNQWFHVALTRSGTTLRLFINGILDTTVTSFTTDFNNTGSLLAGAFGSGTGNNLSGYLSSYRCVKGDAVYTSAFTPPTAPLTAITNTSLLLNFTNAGIYDATSKNDLETVGDAQISNAITPKWGSTSIKFDGTGDYLQLPASINLAFGTGDFTVECWVNNTNRSAATNYPIWDTRNPSNAATTTGAYFALTQTNGYPFVYSNAFIVTGSSGPSLNTWTHIAYVRASGTLTVYVNGTSVGSASFTNNLTDPGVYISRVGQTSSGGTENYTGYIQDLRITKGYARYTANFTAPTAAFPTL